MLRWVSGPVALLLLSQPAFADQVDTLCESVGEAAGKVMWGRQHGVPIGKYMKIASAIDDEYTRTSNIQIIKSAYETPLYHTDEMIEETITEFTNQIQLACYKEYGK